MTTRARMIEHGGRMRYAMICVLLLPLAGCATILTGTSEKIDVATIPAGGKCVLSRQSQTIVIVEPTPGAATVQRDKHDILVTCELPGYQMATQYVHSGVEASTFANVLLGGAIGMGIDGATGADDEYPGTVSLTMTAASPTAIVEAGSGTSSSSPQTPPAQAQAGPPSFTIRTSGPSGFTSCSGTSQWKAGHFTGTCQSGDMGAELAGDLTNGTLDIRGGLTMNGSSCQVDGASQNPSGRVTVELAARKCSGGAFSGSYYFSPSDMTSELDLDTPSSGTAAATVASAASLPAGADVPFSIDLAGHSYEGVAKLKDGHVTGQLEAFAKPVTPDAHVNGNSITAHLSGALDPGSGNLGGACSADGETSPASGSVKIGMLASCPGYDPSIVLHMELPPAPI